MLRKILGVKWNAFITNAKMHQRVQTLLIFKVMQKVKWQNLRYVLKIKARASAMAGLPSGNWRNTYKD